MMDTTEPRTRRAPADTTGRGRPSAPDRQRKAGPPPPADDARIAKVMARAGLCSRRDAETWIAAGRVAVNGRTIDSPALNVGPQDRITIDGQALPEREPTRLFLFHKPRGLVTTSRDPEGRPTIFENLPEGLPRVVSVGRLDINTEGLMLLTNDGGLARVLELPATGWLRRYRVRANGTVDQAQLDALKNGVEIDGVDYAGIEAVLDRQQGANVWLTMGLREGKNREIKRVLESLGLAVTRLIRISFGPFQLGELVAGAAESVPTRVLRDQLGPDLAAKASVVFPEGTARPAAPVRAEARPRAHVSALRTAERESSQGPRRRIERAATADRKGRAVKIERVVPVDAVGARRDAGTSRNARRFAAEKRSTDLEQRPARERLDLGGRTRRDAPPARDERRRDDRGPERTAGSRTPKPFGFKTSARGERQNPDGGRPRATAGKPGGRAGGFGSDRPATGRNRPETFRDRGGDRPKRGGGPSGGRPSGGRPSGGKPTGRQPPRGRP